MSEKPRTGMDRLFNSPLEIGLRSLIVLAEMKSPCDIQRLTIYDYFLLHSGDIGDGPESLHPPSPFRSGELLVKRALIEKGLRLLLAKGLVRQSFDSDGICYVASEVASPFLSYFDSPYANRARAIARWIEERFTKLQDTELQRVVNQRLGQWGSEFIGETLVEEEPT